jgi:hypothetical protein
MTSLSANEIPRQCALCSHRAMCGSVYCKDDALAQNVWTFHKASRAARLRAVRITVPKLGPVPLLGV